MLLGWPGMFYAKSEEDIYNVTKTLCDLTSLAIDLWPKPFFDFGRFHPSKFNPALIERITDIPNVVAMNYTAAEQRGIKSGLRNKKRNY